MASSGAINTVGIIHNPHIEAAAPLAVKIAQAVRHRGAEVWMAQEVDNPEIAHLVAQTDLLVTIGGDGSILRAAHSTAGCTAMILGVNLGRIGFLTETEPDGWEQTLSRVLDGDYWVEERMMLQAEVRRGAETLAQGNALNDVVVGKGAHARAVHLQVRADGDLLAAYVADGLIVATPTGSTAYALAAGGPIMPPQQRNILLVPVAPHLSLNRPVVLADGVQVQVIVGRRTPATLILDGDVVAELAAGDVVCVGASSCTARFARVRERDYFYRTLMARLAPKE